MEIFALSSLQDAQERDKFGAFPLSTYYSVLAQRSAIHVHHCFDKNGFREFLRI
jgi:hypothetical protein